MITRPLHRSSTLRLSLLGLPLAAATLIAPTLAHAGAGAGSADLWGAPAKDPAPVPPEPGAGEVVPEPSDPPASTDPAPPPEPDASADGSTAAEPAPAEGPVPDDYTSSKESGKAISGSEADEGDGLPEDRETVGDTKKPKKGLSHVKTGMLGVSIGAGFQMVTAGDKFCGEYSTDNDDKDKRKSLCTGLRPLALDITAGFGAAPRLDVVVSVRINLMKRDYNFDKCDSDVEPCDEGKGLFNKKVAIGVMPGVRIWGADNDKIFKVGGAIDFMYIYEDFSGYHNRARHPLEEADEQNYRDEARVGNHSIGVRGGPILQIDPHHNVGIYIIPAVAPSLHVSGPTWVEIGFEGHIGFQARFP